MYDVTAARTANDRWILQTLSDLEPDALHTQMPIVWDGASASTVQASDGRRWLDWTSGIAVANAGHAPEPVVDAIVAQARSGLLHSYQFPTEVRARFVDALCKLTGFRQCILYTTGAEAVEGVLKICRLRAQRQHRPGSVIVSFDGGFHGRTQGAQYVGGQLAQRAWLPANDHDYVRLPYPDEPVDTVSEAVTSELDRRAIDPARVAAVIAEPWQGSTLRQISKVNAQALRSWCTRNDVPLIFDEIQTGFGRSGALFAFHDLGVVPDLLLVSKGLSGSLPVAAVCASEPRWTTHLKRGDLTSTHGGNPVALAAAVANLELFADGSLVAHAREIGAILHAELRQWAAVGPRRHEIRGVGVIAGVIFHDGDDEVDLALPRRLTQECADQGLLLVMPATMGGAMVKIMPPLSTTTDELRDGLSIFRKTAERLVELRSASGAST